MPTGIWLYSYMALWSLVALVSMILVLLMRQVSNLYAFYVKADSAWGLRQGEPAPTFSGIELFQSERSSKSPFKWLPNPSEPTNFSTVTFISPSCSACREMVKTPKTLDAQSPYNNREEFWDSVIVFVRGDEKRVRDFVTSQGLDKLTQDRIHILADYEDKAATAYKISMVPYTVVIDPIGQIGAHGGGYTLAELRSLVSQSEEIWRRRNHTKADAAGGDSIVAT